jgi:hypothetical protein
MNILQEAEKAVYGDREADYGSVLENFTTVAKLWSVVAKVELTPEQVGLMMVQLKIARQMNKPLRDNLVDGAGYFATLEKMEEERKGNTAISDNTEQQTSLSNIGQTWMNVLHDENTVLSCNPDVVIERILKLPYINGGKLVLRLKKCEDSYLLIENGVHHRVHKSEGYLLEKHFDNLFKTKRA